MMYQYWSHFLPYTEPSETSLPSLFTIITCEPIHTVRISACSVITTMIDGSKQYLAAADDRLVLVPYHNYLSLLDAKLTFLLFLEKLKLLSLHYLRNWEQSYENFIPDYFKLS